MITGYGTAGTGCRGSVLATTATEDRPSAVARSRVITADPGEAIQARLGLLHGGLVGQGAPPALRGGVVDLLHHALAVTAPGRADRH